MEATMLSTRITQLVIGIAAAIGMAAVGVGAIGNDAVAQSTVEQAQTSPKGGLTHRYETPSSELDFRLGDHQQLKRMLLDGSRDRLK
jgi:phage-related minor tail protein